MTTTKEYKRDKQLFWETQENLIFCRYKEDPIDAELRYLHCHDGYEVLIIEQGVIDMQIEDNMYTLQTGDVLLIPPFVFHFARQQSSHCYHRVVLNFREPVAQALINTDKAFRKFTDAFYKTPDYHLHPGDAVFNKLVTLVHALQEATEDESDKFGNDILSASLLSIILILLNRQSSLVADGVIGKQTSGHSLPDVIKSVIQYVEENYTEKITITQIASDVHLNSVYLTRMFHQYTGLSLQQYIIEKRLSEAQRLLREGHTPTDVCFECGFNNYSNFSRTFSNHVHISPRQFQENARADFIPFRG